MKKKLNEIFDEAKPQEIDQFSDELKAPESPDEVLASVKGKVYAKTNLKKAKTNSRGMWMCFTAIAACFLLIVSAVIVVPMLREGDPGDILGPLDSNNPSSDAPIDSNNPSSDAPIDSNNPSSDAPIDSNNPPSDYVTVTIGTSASDVMPPYAISCEIPTEYSTDSTNIPITLSFGLVEGCTADTDSYLEIVLRAENDEGQTIILKRIDISEILKSEYFVERVWDDNREWVIGFNYTHKESFALPLSLFSSTSGQIHIGLYECSSGDSEDNRYGSGAYIFFSYTRNGSSISISAEADR